MHRFNLLALSVLGCFAASPPSARADGPFPRVRLIGNGKAAFQAAGPNGTGSVGVLAEGPSHYLRVVGGYGATAGNLSDGASEDYGGTDHPRAEVSPSHTAMRTKLAQLSGSHFQRLSVAPSSPGKRAKSRTLRSRVLWISPRGFASKSNESPKSPSCCPVAIAFDSSQAKSPRTET